jgi:hypothetical protein
MFQKAKGGSRRPHSIAAPDVSDELISYYRERKAGEQVRSLRGSQPTIRHRPSCRATLQAERASRCSGAWKHIMTTPVPQDAARLPPAPVGSPIPLRAERLAS